MPKKHALLRHLPAIAGVSLCLLIGIAVYLLRDYFEKPVQTKRTVQQIALIQPPPPPPPEQKPPEPEVKEEKIEEPQPEPEAEKEPEPAPEEAEAPPGDQLGLDAEGGAGSDAFGLASRKGGRSILGGHAGSSILWYGGQLKREVERQLQDLLLETAARKNSYTAVLDVWVGPDGRLSRAELATSSGNGEIDRSLKEALPRLRLALEKGPPEQMPQPVRIRVQSRI